MGFPAPFISSGSASAFVILSAAQFQSATDDTLLATDSTTPTEKLRLTTETLSAGTYQLFWSVTARGANQSRLGLDLVQDPDGTPEELSEITYSFYTNNSSDRYPLSGAAKVALAEGVHIFSINVSALTNNKLVSVYETRLFLAKVKED